MADTFAHFTSSLQSPADHLAAVMPHDGADLPVACRALNVATSGYVQVTTVQGDTGRVFVVAGVAFPVRAARVWATGTTATEIVALW